MKNSKKTGKNMDKDEPVDLCIYCVGIGELLDLSNMEK